MLLAAGLFVLYRLFPSLLPILELIVIAMLLALVFRTAVNRLEQLGAPPWLAAIVLATGVGAFGGLIGLVVVPNLVREFQILIDDAPGYLESLRHLIEGLPFAPDLGQIVERLQSVVWQLTSQLPSLVVNLGWVLGGLVATVFLAMYMAASPGTLIGGFLRLVPRDRRGGVREFIDVLGERLRGWIVGTIIVSLFVGGGAGLGLWVLGVPLPFTFGVLAGVLNVVPYLGTSVGALLPALVALTISPVKALLVVVLFTVLNQIEGNVLQPLVMGREIRAHPAMILISLLVLGALLNVIVGALLAVPTAVLVGTLIDQLTAKEPSLGEKESEEGTDDSRV